MRRLTLLLLLAVFLGVSATPALAAYPTATTQDPFASGSTTAHFAGLVQRGGAESTTLYFEYGTTVSYGNQTPTGTVTASSPLGGCGDCHPVSADIVNLSPGTLYHVRLVATNDASLGEVSYGADKTFTTQAAQQQYTPPTDSDGDGIADSSDACPGQPGPGPSGCPPPPDTDYDGYPDSQGACPGQPGGAAGPTNAQGCPVPTTASPGPSGPPESDPNDVDGDGVPNASDKCPSTFASEKVDVRGCGKFLARAFFGARSTKELQDDPGLGGQCENGAGRQCTFHLTVTLSKASATRLKIKAKIADKTFTTNKSTFKGRYVYNGSDVVFPRAVEKAFKRAYEERIPVTMTFTGTVKLGSEPTLKLPKSTFTMKRKPPGGSAYRVEPTISNGDDGPSAQGLTRKVDPDDS